ncbi:MAG: hypothetical protein IJ250_01435 [Bacteroidales bacterium]|nr:hypothetical protein [Bacteroidales bacterium]
MNKITLKNFFMILLACLLIIVMMLVQLSNFTDQTPLTFTLGLVVMVAACIFVLYETITISNDLYRNKSSLDRINRELQAYKDKETKEQTTQENK